MPILEDVSILVHAVSHRGGKPQVTGLDNGWPAMVRSIIKAGHCAPQEVFLDLCSESSPA